MTKLFSPELYSVNSKPVARAPSVEKPIALAEVLCWPRGRYFKPRKKQIPADKRNMLVVRNFLAINFIYDFAFLISIPSNTGIVKDSTRKNLRKYLLFPALLISPATGVLLPKGFRYPQSIFLMEKRRSPLLRLIAPGSW